MCLVKTYELYINRLNNENDFLWQTPKVKVTWDDAEWYTNESQSKNKIGGLLTFLTKEAHLSKPYTNHCVRATCITLLDRQGFEARYIMTVSGHKNVESIQSYSSKTSEAKKRQMSESLSSAMIKTPPKKQKIAPKVTEADAVHKQHVTALNANNNNNSNDSGVDLGSLSFRDLLELDEEQEKLVLNDILYSDESSFETNQPVSIRNTTSNVNPVALSAQSIIPRMIFSNSSVTINFNITKN